MGTGMILDRLVPAQGRGRQRGARRACRRHPEWIERKTQISPAGTPPPHQATSDLAARPPRRALEQAGLRPEPIDYLIVSTSTADFPQPPTSTWCSTRSAPYGAACFDINVVCSGFVYALALARALVGQAARPRMPGDRADVYSRILDFTDRRTAMLFGDGAGAALVGAVPDPFGIIARELSSRGGRRRLIHVEAGGSRIPASPDPSPTAATTSR